MQERTIQLELNALQTATLLKTIKEKLETSPLSPETAAILKSIVDQAGPKISQVKQQSMQDIEALRQQFNQKYTDEC